MNLSAPLARSPLAFAFVLAIALYGTLRADLVITEIHYAPVDAAGNPRADLEFVEVFNDGPEPYDLYLYRFTEGITFEFTGRTFLAGRSYLVVCRNQAAVQDQYGITNTVGDFAGQLDNAGEDVALANPQGAVVSLVPYNDRGRWPSGAKGTGHSLSIRTPYSDPSDPDSWALSAQMGGTPGAANYGTDVTSQDTVLVDAGTAWRYFKGTQEPSSPTSAWRQPGFADASWLSGATGIGYGDGDDATSIPDMEDGYMTIFCRKTFTVSDVSQVDDLILSITYDDGFFAYLNGAPVASRNITSAAFDSDAGPAIEPTAEDIDITAFKQNLVNGPNVLAVQVHNAGLGSSDLSFIPRLLSRRVISPQEIETVPVVINEGYTRNGGAGGRFIELYNTSASAVDLAGYWLTDDFSQLMKHEIESPAIIPGRGFLSFTEAELGLDLSIVPGTKDRVSIALTNAAGAVVVDAVIFEPAVDGKSEARLPDGGKRLAAAANPTPAAANAVTLEGDVIFNEIFYNPPSGDDLDEFIELHNRSSSPVDVGDWQVEGVGVMIPPGTTIEGGGYLVLCGEALRFERRYGLAPPVLLATPWTGNLRNAGERLNLYDRRGNLVDTVRYRDGGEWSAWADGGGSSLELIDPRSDNDVAGSWDASDESGKAFMQTITYGPVPFGGGESDFGMMLAEEGIAIIDDISLTSAGGTNLISNGTFDSNTTPWRIEGTHIRSGRTTNAAERITGAGSMKLICWNGGGDYKVNRIELDTAAQSTQGPFTVSFKARWLAGSSRIITIGDYNVSQPQNPGLAGSREISSPRDLGTPGDVNSVTVRQIEATTSENVGPAIDGVSHTPGVPEGSQGVTVRARVRDPDGVATVRLFYRTETPVGAFTQVSMTGPDAEGTFSGAIPGQTLDTRVLFYVEATDGSGLVARFPADIFKRTHPPVLNPSSPSPNDAHYCMYRHDTRVVATNRHSYRFLLSQPAQDYLRTRRTHSNEMVNGTFVFGSDDVYYNAQIRFAGSPWLRQGGSFDNSYSIKMPKDKLLHERKLAFNLDEHGSDGRERISHYLFRLNAGSSLLPYFDFHALVRFQLNSVKDATYEAFDKPNRQYISFWFPDADRGPHFEMDDRFSFNDSGDRTGNADGRALYPPYGVMAGGGDKENYRWFFSPRSNATSDNFSPLQFFCYVMDSRTTPNSVFDTQVFGLLDVEEMLRVWAIELNIDDWDTWGARRGKNCYLYNSPADGRWRLIPWDLELTYGDVNAFAMPGSISSSYSSAFSEVTRLMNRPQIKRLYYGILAEMVDSTDGFFHSGFLGPYMQRLSAAGVGNTGVGQSGGFIDTRANLIRGWIRGAVYPQTRLTISTNGGAPLTTVDATVDLEGTAPVDAFHFVVSRNGLFLEPNPEALLSTTNALGWAIQEIPLVPGTNVIEVLGLGSRGDIVDRDTIEVTSGINWGPPVIETVAPGSAATGQEIILSGNDLHSGLKVFFADSIEAASIRFDEALDPGRAFVVVPSSLTSGETNVHVENIDGQQSAPVTFMVLDPSERAFVRGDGNLDGSVDLSDALKVLLSLFGGGASGCRDAMDVDDSGDVSITDPILLLDYVFKAGSPPAAPFPAKGPDPTGPDGLDCEQGF